jgi:hypothetical protein
MMRGERGTRDPIEASAGRLRRFLREGSVALMTTTRTIDQLMRRAKGRALEIKGRASGDRRTALRGRMTRMSGEMRHAAHRFGRDLRRAVHR